MMPRRLGSIVIAVVLADLIALPSHSDDARAMPPFQPHIDIKTFMEHVLQPAATVIFNVNGVRIDLTGEHDLAAKTDDDWEKIVTAAATLAEATNALMIPQRTLDAEWNR